MLEELRLEVNEACNFRCSHCYTDKSTRNLVSIEVLLRAIADAAKLGARDLSLTGGEPLLAPERLRALVAGGKKSGLRVRLNTNGYFLTDEAAASLKVQGLDEVQISLSSDNANEFDALVRHKGAFVKVVGGIAAAARAGLSTSVRYTLMDCNVDRVLPTYRMAASMGAQKFKVRCLVDVPGSGERLTRNGAVASEMRRELRSLLAESKGKDTHVEIADDGLLAADDFCSHGGTRNSCKCGAKALFVSTSGDITPCPFLREAKEFQCGNLSTEGLDNIYANSEVLARFIGGRHADQRPGNDHENLCKASHVAVAPITIGKVTYLARQAV